VSPAPRKVLFVHSSDEMYGADRILLDLARRLDRDRYLPLVVLPTDVHREGLLTQELREHGVPTLGLDIAVLRRRLSTALRAPLFLARLAASSLALSRVIRREAVDLVHSHTAAVLAGAFAARFTARPHVWQTLEIIIEPRLVRRSLAWLMPRMSAAVVAASGPTYDHLCACDPLNRTRARVIRYGIDASRIEAGSGEGARVRREWGIGPTEPLVGVVGRVSAWKGQDYFLEVARRVLATHPAARFAIVGDTFDARSPLVQELKARASRLGLKDAVVFAGYRSDIPAVLDALDVFVLPSTLPDPFPTAVLEAMAAARPVVANAHGGCVEMLVHGDTGSLVPPGKADEMAAAIGPLLDDPGLRARMGTAGRARVRATFTLDSYVDGWMGVYDEVLPTAPAPVA
jgi:glycosyltransferase involved in cell wall biosynthesis